MKPENFYVTGSGMHAIEMALTATVGAGEEAIYLSPAWPNFVGAAGLAGAVPVPVELEFGANGWMLDPEKIAAAITPRTKALFINTPSNPTGWTADRETLEFILDLARKHGLWIIADEIYTHFYYGGGRARSFMDIMEPDDRIIFVNSFSKNWAMTGWRVGWMTVHPSLGPVIENLIQYSNSGVAQFMQRGAVTALDEGDAFISMQVERARSTRDSLCAALISTGKVRLTPPQGHFIYSSAWMVLRIPSRQLWIWWTMRMSGWRPAAHLAAVVKGFSAFVSAGILNRWMKLQNGLCAGSRNSDKKRPLEAAFYLKI